MLIQPFTTRLSNIGQQVFLRCDPKYRHFWDNKRGIPIEQNSVPSVRVKDILLPIRKKVIKKGELDSERPILELNDVESRTSLILQERVVTEIGSDKLDFDDCDLVINKLEPYLGKLVINDTSKGYIGTTEWIPLKLNCVLVKPRYLKYLLLLPEFLQAFRFIRSGKRHARMAEVDFRNIRIPLPSLEQQSTVEKTIEPVESSMVSLSNSLGDPLKITDKAFAREFGYGVEEYQKRAEQNVFEREFSALGKASLIRSTVKYQNPRYGYLEEVLGRYPCVVLKKLCRTEIRRGVQPEYDSEGDIRVVKTLNLKHERLDFTESEQTTQEFFDVNLDAQVYRNDILVSSTGEGRGKVDIYDLEEPALADSHISIISLESDVNPCYVLYFMRSLMGKLQLETLEIAVKGTPEIYPDELEKMRIIYVPPDRQDAIVTEVRTELRKLQKQKAEVQKLRNDIDEILLRAAAGYT